VERSINYYLIDCQAAFSFSLPMPGRRTGNLNPIPKPLYTAIQRDLFASFAIVASSSSLHCAAQQGSSAAAANNNNNAQQYYSTSGLSFLALPCWAIFAAC